MMTEQELWGKQIDVVKSLHKSNTQLHKEIKQLKKELEKYEKIKELLKYANC